MSDDKPDKWPILPPPVEEILLFAMLTLANENGKPNRQNWLWHCQKILAEENWKEELLRLALQGFRLTNTPPELDAALKAAFDWPDFHTMLKQALANLADTLPEPKKRSWLDDTLFNP